MLVEQLPDLRRAVMQGIGEPLLNRDLAPMIRHLKQRGVYVVFNTNADAGQTIFHVHLHLLGGQPLGALCGGPIKA